MEFVLRKGFPLQVSSPSNYRTVNVISQEDFEKITPPMPRASNPDIPPPPPGLSSGYDEVFEMEEDTKSPKEETAAQKQVGILEFDRRANN